MKDLKTLTGKALVALYNALKDKPVNVAKVLMTISTERWKDIEKSLLNEGVLDNSTKDGIMVDEAGLRSVIRSGRFPISIDL